MTLETNSQKPKRTTIAGNTVEQHSLKEQIEYDRYQASKAASTEKKRGVNFAKLKHSGTV